MCCEFEEVWSTSAALERVPLVVKNATRTDEHFHLVKIPVAELTFRAERLSDRRGP